MYDVVLYKDKHGYSPLKELIDSLVASAATNKNNRVALRKIQLHINNLKRFGTRMGEPFVKHIEDDIWELRPGNGRIFFSIKRNTIILLHGFQKKSQKTPRREIERAKRELKDWVSKYGCL